MRKKKRMMRRRSSTPSVLLSRHSGPSLMRRQKLRPCQDAVLGSSWVALAPSPLLHLWA